MEQEDITVFSREIYDLTFTNDIANEMFPHIIGDSYNGDITFLATLRALLAPRMKEEDFVQLVVNIVSERESTVASYGDEEFVENFVYSNGNNTFLICMLNGTEGMNTVAMQKIDRAFCRVNEGYEELEDIRVFTQKQAEMRFYINREMRSSVIFIAAPTVRLWHYVQSFISRMVPWYFDENPLNEEEMKLARALVQRYASEYERLIQEMAEKYDFRSKRIQILLNGFEINDQRRRLKDVEVRMKDNERNINRNVDQYMQLIEQRTELAVQRDGLKLQISEGVESELAEYFVCNKHLNPISVDGSRLLFIVSCYLENFDPEMFEQISKNEKSYIYTDYAIGNSKFRPIDVRKRFLSAIFSDEPLLKIKMCAYYNIDLRGSVSSYSGYTFPTEYDDRIPNPHLQRHNCIGNHKRYIEECLRARNNIGAVEQCIASAKSINIGESATFPYLLKELFADGCNKVIELPDGTSCTPSEAYDWLVKTEEKGDEAVVEEANEEEVIVVREQDNVDEVDTETQIEDFVEEIADNEEVF